MPPKQATSGNRSLPKFGEWDVNNPQSGEGFTVIFNTHRDQKKNSQNNTGPSETPNNQNQSRQNQNDQQKEKCLKKKLFPCFFGSSS